MSIESAEAVEATECKKLSAVAEYSQRIGGFLEWLLSGGSSLGDVELVGENGDPVYFSTNRLLAEYFDIDLDKVDEERRQILEALSDE